jgi:hypothetical protein
MNPVLLGLQAVVFVVWGALMFRALFMLRARAVQRSGQSFPGLGATLESYGAFLGLPEFRRDRRLLGAATLALFGMIAVNVALAPPLPPPAPAPVAPGFPMPPVSR